MNLIRLMVISYVLLLCEQTTILIAMGVALMSYTPNVIRILRKTQITMKSEDLEIEEKPWSTPAGGFKFLPPGNGRHFW